MVALASPSWQGLHGRRYVALSLHSFPDLTVFFDAEPFIGIIDLGRHLSLRQDACGGLGISLLRCASGSLNVDL